ncbi:MAG TPA: hypothetical protein VK862_03930 [Afifellaceae bacterium]|nr:hypothetical protein [Afifellaceae bacterium]
MLSLLAVAARHGRWLLIAGLAAGIGLPALAAAMRPWLPEMVAVMLFLAALRVGPRQALGAWRDLTASLTFVVAFQVLAPVLAALAFAAIGWQGGLASALIIALAASPIAGSPSLTIMLGHDPAAALRQLVVGTAFLPLTVIPVFALVPAFGDPLAILHAAFRLLMVIAGATALAFAVRLTILRDPSARAVQAVDGLLSIAMAILVIGLMAAVAPALYSEPVRLFLVLAAATAFNFGLQIIAASALARGRWRRYAVPMGVVAGNRNIALFLAALPAAITDPLLLFIGCYQVPMYLTPILLKPFYEWVERGAAARN